MMFGFAEWSCSVTACPLSQHHIPSFPGLFAAHCFLILLGHSQRPVFEGHDASVLTSSAFPREGKVLVADPHTEDQEEKECHEGRGLSNKP